MTAIYNVYRRYSTSETATQIATNLTDKNYSDSTVIYGSTPIYSIGAAMNGLERISDEMAIDTILSKNELLIFADATSYPSSNFVDSSAKSRTVTANGGIQMVNTQTKLYDDGWVNFDNTGVYSTANKYLTTTLQSMLDTDDFTFECFIKPDYSKSTQYSRIFAIGTHSTNGMISLSKSGSPWELNLDIYNNGWNSGAFVSAPPTVNDGQISHVCLMRKSGIFYVFVRGILSAQKSDFTAFSLSQTNTYIGAHPFNEGTLFDSFGGFMSSIRLTRFARYATSGFTPPDYKFPKV